jgi:kinetochore protein Fta7
MTAALHSVDLLKAELAKEDEGLDQDQRELEELRRNSKKEMGFWKSQAKKASLAEATVRIDSDGRLQKHPLVELPEMDSEIDDSADQIGVVFESKGEGIFEAADENVKPLVRQLRNHLDSIRSNSMQVEGIQDAIREGSILLDSVIHQKATKAAKAAKTTKA